MEMKRTRLGDRSLTTVRCSKLELLGIAAIVAILIGFVAPARAQFVPGQPLTAAALNNALANPKITGGSVVTSVLTGNLLLSNFAAGSGATVNTCWLGNLSWGTCAIAGTGIIITGRTVSLSTPVSVTNGGTGATTFTSNAPLIGAGSSAISVGTVTGNTTKFATSTGSLTTNHCAKWDASGNVVDAGAECGGGSGVTLTNPQLTVQALTDASTIAWNMSSGNVATVTVSGASHNIGAPTNIPSGGSAALLITYSGSGTIGTFDTSFKWPAGTTPTWTNTSGKKDMVTCNTFGGSTLYCAAVLDVH